MIHVGAHAGEERDLYAKYELPVLWIEAIPAVFDQLCANLEGYPKQRALLGLVTDRDGEEYEFHVSSNEGHSSSIFDLGLHRDIWPEVAYESSIRLRSSTLPSLLDRTGVDPSAYDGLVMDTQGSELLVLHGAAPLLADFRYIQTEAADFAVYEGGCQLADIEAFMSRQGFKEYARRQHVEHPEGGGSYDIVYRRRSS